MQAAQSRQATEEVAKKATTKADKFEGIVVTREMNMVHLGRFFVEEHERFLNAFPESRVTLKEYLELILAYDTQEGTELKPLAGLPGSKEPQQAKLMLP